MQVPSNDSADATLAEVDTAAGVEMRRLRWHARRGLLENDILLGRFFERHGAALGPARRQALAQLLELPDGTLLDLVLGRADLPAALDRPPVQEVLLQLRAA